MDSEQQAGISFHLLKYPAITLSISSLFVVSLFILILYSYTSYHRTQIQQQNFANEISRDGVHRIVTLLSNLRRELKLFSYENETLLNAFTNNPHDEKLYSQICHQAENKFPSLFSFDLRDEKGRSLRKNPASQSDSDCRLTKYNFSHPTDATKIHFDILIDWKTIDDQNIFLAAGFTPHPIELILDHHNTQGFSQLLMRQNQPDLIEAGLTGSKGGNAYFITDAQKQRILSKQDIPSTGWYLVTLIDKSLIDRTNLEYILFFSLSSSILLCLTFLLHRFLIKREQSHQSFDASITALARSAEYAENDLFMENCVMDLRSALCADYAFIGIFDNEHKNSIKIIHYSGHSPHIKKGVVYDLEGTPCQDIIDEKNELISSNLQQYYPDDALLNLMNINACFGVPLKNNNNEVIGLVTLMHTKMLTPDKLNRSILHVYARRISLEMLHAQTLVQAKEKDNQLTHLSRLNTMGEMSTILAHEINQPLMAITSYSGIAEKLCRSISPLPDNLKHAITQSGVQAHRAADMIKHLRKLTQKHIDKMQYVSVNQIITDTQTIMIPYLKDLKIELNLELTAFDTHVLADEVQIEQVLINLIRNAAEAISENRKEDSRISIHTSQKNNYINVTVCDNGPGIPENIRHEIMQAFFSTKKNGMGMGLGICRTILEHHNSSLKIQNKLNGLTCFKFKLAHKVL